MGPIVFVIVFLLLPLSAAAFLGLYVLFTIFWRTAVDVHPAFWALTFVMSIGGGIALGLYRASLRSNS